MPTPEEEHPSQLTDALGILRRRWTIIAAVLLIVPLAVFGWSSYVSATEKPSFQAVQRLAINPERGISSFRLEQAVVLVNDGDAGRAACDELDDHPGVSVEARTDSSVGAVEIVATSADKTKARTVVDVYAETLLEYLANVDLDAAGRSLDEKREAVGAAEADLTRIWELQSADPDAQQVQIEYDDAVARYEAALEEVRRAEATGRPTAPLRSLSASSVSEAPSSGFASSGLTRQLLSALLIAAVLGIGAAYAWEALDHRLADAQSVGRAFGVPILTEVPDGGKGFAGASALAPPASVISEAYRRLRTILRIAHGSGPVVVLVTSPGPSEGKTTTVAHLARALGEVGARVLAVSADFRKPQLHRYFDVEATPPGIPSPAGDTTSAPSDAETPRLIQETALAGVSIATRGQGTADPTNLIHYARRLIAAAKGHYDYVLIDTSPLLSANDALDFVDDVDAVILIAKFGATTRPAAERTRDLLLGVGAPVMGVVLTGVKDLGQYGYYYGGYQDQPEVIDLREETSPSTV